MGQKINILKVILIDSNWSKLLKKIVSILSKLLKTVGLWLKQAAQNSRFFMKQAAQNSRFFCCTPWFDWTTMWKNHNSILWPKSESQKKYFWPKTVSQKCIFDQSLNLKKNWCILIKNEKMGQKIYKKCENGSKNKLFLNVIVIDSICSKLLKKIVSILSKLLKTVGILAVRLDLTKLGKTTTKWVFLTFLLYALIWLNYDLKNHKNVYFWPKPESQKYYFWPNSEFQYPLIKNAKMGHKINVPKKDRDRFFCKLLKTVGLLVDSICSQLLKTVGLLEHIWQSAQNSRSFSLSPNLTKLRLKNH